MADINQDEYEPLEDLPEEDEEEEEGGGPGRRKDEKKEKESRAEKDAAKKAKAPEPPVARKAGEELGEQVAKQAAKQAVREGAEAAAVAVGPEALAVVGAVVLAVVIFVLVLVVLAAALGAFTGAKGEEANDPGGGLGISPEGFVFPLRTTQTLITTNSPRWCYTSDANCHHDYNAADIFIQPGTEVVAAKPGRVVRAVNQVGGVGSRVAIKGDDGFLYYYAHMADGSVVIPEGTQVAAGQVLGRIGESIQAVGTPPHLHFDMLPSEYSARPSCSGAACTSYPFINVQPVLRSAFSALPP